MPTLVYSYCKTTSGQPGVTSPPTENLLSTVYMFSQYISMEGFRTQLKYILEQKLAPYSFPIPYNSLKRKMKIFHPAGDQTLSFHLLLLGAMNFEVFLSFFLSFFPCSNGHHSEVFFFLGSL